MDRIELTEKAIDEINTNEIITIALADGGARCAFWRCSRNSSMKIWCHNGSTRRQIAGYEPEQIAPLFNGYTNNVILPKTFR